MDRLKHMFIAAATGAAVLVAPTIAAADADPIVPRPAGPNPYLSLIEDSSQVDYEAWRRYLDQQAAVRAKSLITGDRPLEVVEAEPNDSQASAQAVRGLGTGPGRRSTARITGQLSPSPSTPDLDFYRVELRAGDVLGASVQGEAHRLTIFDPAGVEVQGSPKDNSALYPATSPLPGGGNATVDHVAAVGGTHYLAVAEGSGGYEVTVGVLRPALEREIVPQIVFLDFDGAQVDGTVWGLDPPLRTLSSFRDFLGGWGLTAADEPALVRQIVRTVRENLVVDVVARGNNPHSRLRILNSRDHPDLFGRENVSRVVIGGSIAEFGFTTVGIAQSIDPGNFDHEETAVVLLDTISQPAGPSFSLNTYLTTQSNKIEFIGRAIGNIVTHEIGHYVGNWHTDTLSAAPNLMDSGQNVTVRGLVGAGPDNVGGTADDIDIDFGSDVYRPSEGRTGTEDTLNRTAFGLSGFRVG